MKRLYLAISIIFIAAVVVVIFWQRQKIKIPIQQKTPQASSTSFSENFEMQINNEGGVTIEVTPQSISSGTFLVVLDTHSVDLSDDLTKIAVLKDENGKEYKPINWEGTPPGGHHREGILKFEPLSSTLKKIELVISGIGGISERKFLWTTLP